jgi:protein gp37
MYDWVTHTHSALAGSCPHQCTYCYVTALGRRWEVVKNRHSGPIRLVEGEMETRFGEGRTIFIEHMSDLFAEQVPTEFIQRILAHCAAWPKNTYVFQSKNPARFAEFIPFLPAKSILGTTIESNRVITGVSTAPAPEERYLGMRDLKHQRFVTVEPILDFDPAVLAGWIADIKPAYLNIGADSKMGNLPEPSKVTILDFLDRLKDAGITVRKKTNLQRLLA